jgi:Icc-related predicted phosphoesterase
MKRKLIRILYVTDLHGNLAGYNRLVALAEKLSPDIVINGGDMYPKFGSDDLISLQTEFIKHELKEHFVVFKNYIPLFMTIIQTIASPESG